MVALVRSRGTRIIIKEFTHTFGECYVGLWDIAGCTGGWSSDEMIHHSL